MVIGIPKEIKDNEYRVSITTESLCELIWKHKVIIQKDAGVGSGFSDKDYIDAGGEIIDNIKEIYEVSDMIVQVKEPIEPEYSIIKKIKLFLPIFISRQIRNLLKLCLAQVQYV